MDALQVAWETRTRLWCKADTLLMQPTKGKLCLKHCRRYRALGDQVWDKAVLKEKGNIKLDWNNGTCTLESGKVFEK